MLPLMSVGALAAHLGVHTASVKRMVADGRLPPPLRVGVQRSWEPASVMRHLHEQAKSR